MPPKRGPRGHEPHNRSSSSSSNGGRRNFSIATFFDAASSSPHRRGAAGFRVGSGDYAVDDTLATLSQMASALRDNRHDTHVNGRQQHEEAEGEEHRRENSNFNADYSGTLQDVHARILAEVAEEQEALNSGRRLTGPSKLHQHRQRVLQIAFGSGEGRGNQGSDAHSGNNSNSRNGSQDPLASARLSNRGSAGGSGSKEDADDGLMVSSVEFSLLCPYSRLPMVHPVRSRDCRHVQCCDLKSWMVLLGKYRSLRDPKGPCPVCEQRVSASSLEVDFWMMNVMAQMPPGTRLVELDADGSYTNGDLMRERRKAMVTTEIIDATQEGDYVYDLGDVIDEDDDSHLDSAHGGAVPAPPQGSRTAPKGKRQRSPSLTAVDASQNERGINGYRQSSDPTLCSVKKETFLQRQEQEGGGHAPAVSALDRRTSEGDRASEPQAQLPIALAQPSLPSSSSLMEEGTLPSQDLGVVVVYCVEGTMSRTLPSQVRLWVPHCPSCQTPLLKGEDGMMEACRNCGQTTRERWALVRRFEESSAVSMELTPDDTLVLRGVDAASAYLFRAGFQRTPFGPAPPRPTVGAPHSPVAGVWTTSIPLQRVELDFAEACCQCIARGEDLEKLSATVPVPPLFRIPRRRHSTGYQSYSVTQQQQQQQQPYDFSQQSNGRNASSAASGIPAANFSHQRVQPSLYHPLSAGR